MKLSQARVVYAEEWIAFQIVGDGEDPEGEVVFHSADRAVYGDWLRKNGADGLYLAYGADPYRMEHPIWMSAWP